VEQVFGHIYRHRLWDDGESLSGPGSGLARTEALRADLAALVRQLGIRSLLDAGCGDFHWMQAAHLGVDHYIGVDVVRDLVDCNRQHHAAPGRSFVHLNVIRDPLPRVDLILCRDVLPHLSFADIAEAIANFKRSRSTWLLTNTFVNRQMNDDIRTGEWRTLNLELLPFSFPAPAIVLDERCRHTGGIYADKRLALWSLSAL
jgi:hypothetical protein